MKRINHINLFEIIRTGTKNEIRHEVKLRIISNSEKRKRINNNNKKNERSSIDLLKHLRNMRTNDGKRGHQQQQ